MFQARDPFPSAQASRARPLGSAGDDFVPALPARLVWAPPLAGPFGALLLLAMALAGIG